MDAVKSGLTALLFGSGLGAVLLFVLTANSFGAVSDIDRQQKGDVSDIACMVIAIRGTQSADEFTMQAFRASAIYFLGRLQGANPNMSLTDLMRNEVYRQQKLKLSDLEKENRSCATVLRAAGNTLAEASKALSK